MPSSRRPQRSVAAGVAASGFLVAAVVGGFLVVGGLVTYGVWPTDPAEGDAPALVLDRGTPAIVLAPPPPAPEPSDSGPAPAPGGPAPAVASVVPARSAPTSALTPRRPALGVSERPSESGGTRPPSENAGSGAAPAPSAGGLEPVVDAAENLTAGAARRLRSAGVAVEAMTAPLSPDVARVAGDTVGCVADVVEGAGAALAQGLRGVRNLAPAPAAGFPGARPSADETPCRLAPQVPGATDGDAEPSAPDAPPPGG